VSAPPAIGAPAPPLRDALTERRPAVVAFLRHAGCPFAEATMLAMRAAAARTDDLDWIAVSHAPAPATERWCLAIGGAGAVALLVDERRACYAAWGLGRTTLSHFAGAQSLAAVAQLARRGVRNRHPAGTRWQGAGTFALDAEHLVRWWHLPAHAGELPDLEAASSAARGRAAAPPS
jgi:hypothetical protein